MKKLLFSLACICICLSNTQAQSYEMVNAPDTILYYPNDGDITISSHLRNVSGATDTLIAERISNELAPGHQTAFAWNFFWFAYEINSSLDLGMYVILQDQEIDSSFQLTLSPNLNGGTTRVKMRFSSLHDSTKYLDHSYVFVSNLASSMTQENIAADFALNSFVDQDQLILTYKLPDNMPQAQIAIINLQGKKVHEQVISGREKTTTFQLSHLPSGMYVICLLAEEKIAASRSFVKK